MGEEEGGKGVKRRVPGITTGGLTTATSEAICLGGAGMTPGEERGIRRKDRERYLTMT